MNIELDQIIKKFKKQLQSDYEKVQLMNLIREVSKLNLNVDFNQLIRIIPKLANFQPNKFIQIVAPNFSGDSRDIIFESQNSRIVGSKIIE